MQNNQFISLIILVVVTLGVSAASLVFISSALSRQDEAFSRLAAIESDLDEFAQTLQESSVPKEGETSFFTEDENGNFFGFAEVEGIWTTVMRATTLGIDSPMTECQGFELTDAPEELTDFLSKFNEAVVPRQNGNLVLVTGELDGRRVEGDTQDVLVTLPVTGPGEVVGCMSVPGEVIVIE